MLGGLKLKTFLALLIVLGVALLSRGQKLRAENRQLVERLAKAQRLAGNSDISRLSAIEGEIETINDANKDLFKLRNEVTHLRRLKQEHNKLRVENQELLARTREGGASKLTPALTANFLHRANLVDAGFATPEATLQTFFRSVVYGELRRFQECLLHPELLTADGDAESTQQQFRKATEPWKDFPGYSISETQVLGPDRVVLQTRTSADGKTVRIPLQRVNNEWKIAEMPK